MSWLGVVALLVLTSGGVLFRCFVVSCVFVCVWRGQRRQGGVWVGARPVLAWMVAVCVGVGVLDRVV